MARNTTLREDENGENTILGVISIKVTDLTPILEWVQENFTPEDIFDDGELDAWAIENGYAK